MKYRIRVDAIIDINDNATRTALLDTLNLIYKKFLRINELEGSFITLEECHHDETPPAPCVTLYNWQA